VPLERVLFERVLFVRAVERLCVAVVRSAEAGAWLRATLGDRNVGAGAVCAACVGVSAGAVGAVFCVAGAGAATCGATTLNDAGAKPPVGREAVIV
jgi:hypothetical protein